MNTYIKLKASELLREYFRPKVQAHHYRINGVKYRLTITTRPKFITG